MRCHTEEEWKNHPLAGHGFNGSAWTHPDAKAAHDAEVEAAFKKHYIKPAIDAARKELVS
jgi:hypothetical protein